MLQPSLSLAVIAIPPRFQNAPAAECYKCRGDIGFGINCPVVRRRNANTVEERLLVRPVLRHGKRFRTGMQRGACGRNRFHGAYRNILEFQRDDVARAGKARQRFVIVIACLPVFHCDPRGRCISFRAIDVHVKAKLTRGDSEHPAQLSAAKDPDHGAWWQGCHPSGTSATPSVCAAR